MVVPCPQCYAHRGLSPLLTRLLLSHSLICILLIATDACQRSLGVVNLKLRSLALEIQDSKAVDLEPVSARRLRPAC